MVSIALVDDHPLMIEGIITLFSRAHGLEITSTGSSASDIIDISSRFRPDVIIVDLSMPGDVYGAIATSITVSPNTKIVAFLPRPAWTLPSVLSMPAQPDTS